MKKVEQTMEEMSREEVIRYLNETVIPEEGTIPAYILGDPTVHKLEQEKVFMKTWIFIGHESEIPKPGDYITRQLSDYSVIISRDDNHKVHGFYNMCTHRGMKLCRADKGSNTKFTCPYHGFVFKNTGELIGVPLQKDVYGDNLDKSKMSLHHITIDSYKGLLFGTWNENPESLSDFLGDFKWYLDMVFGRAEMKAVGPPQRYIINAHWKIGADNFVGDSYHTMMTHGSVVQLGMVPGPMYSKKGFQIHTSNGHGCNIGYPNPDFAFPEELIPEYKSNLSAEQFEFMSKIKNFIGTIFPNLSFLISHTLLKGKLISNTSIRLWRPISNNQMEVVSWLLVEKNASEDWKNRSRESFIFTFSPSGIFEQDDTEVFTDITAAAAGSVPFMKNYTYNYTMGLHRTPITDFPGPGIVYSDKFTEANQRNYYRYWLDLINA